MMTALGITFAAYEPLQRVLSYFGWEPLVGCVDLHRTGFDEPFTTLDRLTQNADPLLTPLENLHEGITRELNRLEIRLLPSTNDNPTVDPGSDAANAIIRDVATIGALLLGDHSLADLQRFRDRAPARYAEITGSRDLSDFDRQFLAEYPPGTEPYFDVMLGACHGKGQQAMRFLYAGVLDYLEAVLIDRTFERAGDTFPDWALTPPAILETLPAWRGHRHARFQVCLRN